MRASAFTVLLLTLVVCKLSAAQSGMPEDWRELLREALSEAAGLDADRLEGGDSTYKQDIVVPQFMLDMYDCWNTMDDDNETNVMQHCHRAIVDEEEDSLPKAVQEADTMLTFLHEGSSKKHPLDAVSMGSIGRSASLHFVPKCQTHKPMSAEFRIHKRVTNMEKLPEQCRRTIEDSGISVQLWISDERKGNRTVEFVRHIRTQQVLLLGQQWVLFKDLQDVTGDWFRNSSQCGKMKSIYITLGEGCAGVDPALLGFDTGNTSGTHEQPFFSIFTKNEDEENTHSLLGKGPLNITEILEQKRRERKDVSSVYAQYLQDRVRMEISEQKKNSCQAYDFRVDLADVGWDNIVKSPASGFITKYCLGHCVYPLDTSRDSFHAIIQAIANIHRPDEVPPPCCAPKTLAPLVVILRLQESQLVMKKIPDLLVTECACL